jgi:hypothetical protein
MRVINLIGQKFGRATVVREAGRNRHGHVLWEILCECGNRKIVSAQDLRRGGTRSCGCLLKKHGGHESKEYAIWSAMKQRCTNPKSKYYPNYGGRGIKVCDRWLDSYEDFIADMGPRPSSRYSLDRVDNDGNYEPGNCRWATWKQQHRHRNGNTIVTANGTTGALVEICERHGLNYRRVLNLMRGGTRTAQEAIETCLPIFRNEQLVFALE